MKIKCQEHYEKTVKYAESIGEVAKDGTRGVVGGLLYHGKPDQSFAVMIGGPFHGWSIHT